MQTISISTTANSNGDRQYRAALGDQESIGKTAGEALDALTLQIGHAEINGFLLLQNFQPDQFFTSIQQQRLAELMNLWRSARDQGDTISANLQSELDALIEAELDATVKRAQVILRQTQQ